MKKPCFLLLVVSIFWLKGSAQFNRYIVQFKDKAGTPFSTKNPAQFLSPKSIERRIKQHIGIDETDLPVVPAYIDSLRLSGDVIILDNSKWLNQVCIQTSDMDALAKIRRLPFVINAQPVMRISHQPVVLKNKFTEKIKNITARQTPASPAGFYSYGNSYQQIHIHEGEYLHDKGFHGEGMRVALIDAGFYHFQNLPAFDSIRINNQIIATYDFVNNETSVNEDDAHGMQCLSIIAGNIPGKLVGSSPKAEFYLYRTEDVASESPVEEQYWIAAAEKADSSGADVISTSLGYTVFDNPVFNYTYADMNGRTSMIARAATFAAKKGMIVLAAAGNEGDKSWHFLVTPGDADSILAVGAVDISGVPGVFSSYGPSAGGSIKPTVASLGVGTTISSAAGTIVSGNGTSFSTPNMAGLVTCLWQAFPEFTNMEIIEAVKKSSSIYTTPNDRIGYGIPNFRLAFLDLDQQRALRNINTTLGNSSVLIYPNPFRDNFTVLIKPANTAKATFRLYDASGKLYFSKKIDVQADQAQAIQFDLMQPLQSGVYVLRFSDGKRSHSLKVVVQ